MTSFDLFKYKRSQNVYEHPTADSLKKIHSAGCSGIAKQLMENTASTDDYGNLAREMAILILETLSDNMNNNENILEFIMKNSSQFTETKILFPNGEWEVLRNGYKKI